MGMRYRKIHVALWNDPDFFSLEPEYKALYFYLVTCPSSHMAGIYFLRIEFISCETGMSRRKIKAGIECLIEKNLIKYDWENCVVWVMDMLTYQGNKSEKILKCVGDHLVSLCKSPLLEQYLKTYAEKGFAIPHRYPIDTLSIPHRYPIDTPSIPYPDHQNKDGYPIDTLSTQEQEQEQDLGTGTLGGSAEGGTKKGTGTEKEQNENRTPPPSPPSGGETGVPDASASYTPECMISEKQENSSLRQEGKSDDNLANRDVMETAAPLPDPRGALGGDRKDDEELDDAEIYSRNILKEMKEKINEKHKMPV